MRSTFGFLYQQCVIRSLGQGSFVGSIRGSWGPGRTSCWYFIFTFELVEFRQLLRRDDCFVYLDHNWSDTASEKDGNSAPPTPGFLSPINHKALQGVRHLPIDASLGPHEYHEISDEDVAESPGFDLGPSLMDEVLRALGAGSGQTVSQSPHTERTFDWKEDHGSQPGSQPESKRGTLKDTLRKKQAHVYNIFALFAPFKSASCFIYLVFYR